VTSARRPDRSICMALPFGESGPPRSFRESGPLEEGVDRLQDPVPLVHQGEAPPLVEGGARVDDAAGDPVADRQPGFRGGPEVRVLVVEGGDGDAGERLEGAIRVGQPAKDDREGGVVGSLAAAEPGDGQPPVPAR